MMPPLWVQVKVHDKKGRFNLCLPLFLLWLILLPFAVILLPFLLVLFLVRFLFTWRFDLLRFVGHAYLLLCAARGTTIDVRDKKQHVLILIR